MSAAPVTTGRRSSNSSGASSGTLHEEDAAATGADGQVLSEKKKNEKDEGGALARAHTRRGKGPRADGKVELREAECYDKLGYSYKTWQKWWILSVIFVVQCSMNMNAGIYGSALTQIEEEFGVVPQTARLGQGLFLITYAFGCELWAPFSEELGRKPILQASLFLVNIWAMACALAPNFPALVIFRVLQGFSSAGGSVTLGMVADLFEPDRQGMAVNFIVLSSVGGSVLGPIVGAFQARYLSWHWNFWLQLIFGGAVQFMHLFVPETKASVLVTREAKRRRAEGETNIYSGSELDEHKWEIGPILRLMSRPFVMFATEPIVLCLSLLSGFSDALIFTFLESFSPIFKQWNFGTIAIGLAFIPICIGYILTYFSFIPFIIRNERDMQRDPDNFEPERKLYWLLYTAPCLTIGLFGFAWTSMGPQAGIPWIAPLLFSAVIGVANFAIYAATIDYMIQAYGPYSASATGGNGFARDFLAGVATFYAAPLYENLGTEHHFEWASTLLGFLAILVTIPVYVFYIYGPRIRAKSKFAQVLAGDRKELRKELGGSNEKSAQAAGPNPRLAH